MSARGGGWGDNQEMRGGEKVDNERGRRGWSGKIEVRERTRGLIDIEGWEKDDRGRQGYPLRFCIHCN